MNNIKSTLPTKRIPYKLDNNWTWYKWEDLIESYQQGLIRSNSQLSDDHDFEYFKMNFIDEKGAYSLNNLPRTFASSDELELYKIKKGDFFINVRNSLELVGKCCSIIDIDRTILYNHMLVRIVHKNSIPSSYIASYFNTKFGKKLLDTCKKGTTTVIALYQKDIYELPIPIPNRKLLNYIDGFINSINCKIEVNNKINAELEVMAKTLYDYWFVQFDFPNEDGKPYKSSGGEMVYNSILKGEIPEGWEVTLFIDWIKQTKTGDWGKEDVEGNYTARVYCVRGADINGLNGKSEVKAPERFILQNNLSKKLEPNDFIIEISGGSPTQSTARIALLTKESFDRFDTDVVCSNFCKAVTLKDEAFAFNFQQEWQRLYDAGVFFGFEGKTSGIKNFLYESFMESYHIVKPNKDLVLRYNSIAKELEKKKQSNLKQNQELTQLRDWLLPMLMNGQVSVADETEEVLRMVAEPIGDYETNKDGKENRFALWLSNQKLAARGDIDEVVLREIFDAMDDEDQ